MTTDFVVQVVRQALITAFWLSAPLLAVGFIAGIAISLVQIVTSMQDSAVGAVPRLAAFAIALVLALPWMLAKAIAYTVSILGDLSRYAH